MGNIFDDIREIVDSTSQTINDAIDDIEKSKKVYDYFSESNSDRRYLNAEIIRYYDRKGDKLLGNALIMWVCMIVVTVACWFCFDTIVEWFNIQNTFLAFLTVLGIDAGINLIIAGIVHLFRH